MLRGPTRYTLFPYTTLFRSRAAARLPQLRRGSADLRFDLLERVRPGRRPGEPSGESGQLRPDRRRRGRPWWCVHLAERSEEHTSELQSHSDLVCRLLLEKKK